VQSEDKQDNVMELVTAIAEFVETNPGQGLSDWLQGVMLASDAEGDEAGVNMMTLHMAKGLEFDRVFLVGLEDGLLPHFNSSDDNMSLEEERRLLYVGMTRARKKLSLSAAYMRRTWGQTQSNDVSRFLREIPSKFVNVLTPPGGENPLEVKGRGGQRDADDDDSQYYDYASEDGGFSDSSETLIEQGASVFHPAYGAGTVEQIETNFGRPKVLVRFKDIGLRRVEAHHLSAGHD